MDRGSRPNPIFPVVPKALCAALLLALAAQAAAQTYPNKPVRLIVPIAAGGGLDTIARPIAQKLAENLGQAIVVDNRGGASGTIAAESAKYAAPDGYTILMTSATLAIRPLLYKVPYDLARDFAPISQLTSQSHLLMANNSLPAKSVSELVALAKASPGKLNYGSVGNGSQPHLAAEMFQHMTGTKLNHIPYKGAAPATTDLLSGQIDLAFLNAPVLLPHIASGKLRALATTTMKRAEQLPDVPTLDEFGLKGFDVATWYGVTAPAGTPPAIVDRLAAVLGKVLASPEIKAKFAAQGTEVFLLPPKEFAAYVHEDAKRLTDLIKSANIQGE